MRNTSASAPCVYVFHPIGCVLRPVVLALKVCRDVAEAQILAHAIRDVFRCPVWIENFDQPSNFQTFKVRGMSDTELWRGAK